MVRFQSFSPPPPPTKKGKFKKAKKEFNADKEEFNADEINGKSTPTPWISGAEWKNVYRQLFDPSLSPSAWQEAYTTMERWSRMTCVNVPTTVVATIPLLRAKSVWRSYHARSRTAPNPDWLQQCFTTPREQTLLYTNLAIVQFVNAFVKEEEHRHDVRGNTVSMKELGSMAGLPDYCITLRNNFVHGSAAGARADENGLRETVVDQLWVWIKTQYWDVELEALNISERLQEALQGIAIKPPGLCVNINQLLKPTPDNDPREMLFQAIDTALRQEANTHDGLMKCRQRRVRNVVEEVVQQLLLQDQLRSMLVTKGPECSCGIKLKVEPMKSILNFVCWLLTYTLGPALSKAPPPPTTSAERPADDLQEDTAAITGNVLASQDVADTGYTVADHVLTVLLERATEQIVKTPKEKINRKMNLKAEEASDVIFLAKQWLLILAGNCCPSVAAVYRRDYRGVRHCLHFDMFLIRHNKKKQPKEGLASDGTVPGRVFYPRQLPAPSVRWRPLVRRMLETRDAELNSMAWMIVGGTFPTEDMLRLRDTYFHHEDTFAEKEHSNLKTLAPATSSTPISGVRGNGARKRTADISVSQLLEAMAGTEADHVQQTLDQPGGVRGMLVKDLPCNTGREALNFDIDTLSQELLLTEPENIDLTDNEDKSEETATPPKPKDIKNIDVAPTDVKQQSRMATPPRSKMGGANLRSRQSPKSVKNIVKLRTPKTSKKNPALKKQTRPNAVKNIVKCGDNPESVPHTQKGTTTSVLKPTPASGAVSPPSTNVCENFENPNEECIAPVVIDESKTSGTLVLEQMEIKFDPSCQTTALITSATQFKQSIPSPHPIDESLNHSPNEIKVAAELPTSMSKTNSSMSDELLEQSASVVDDKVSPKQAAELSPKTAGNMSPKTAENMSPKTAESMSHKTADSKSHKAADSKSPKTAESTSPKTAESTSPKSANSTSPSGSNFINSKRKLPSVQVESLPNKKVN